MAEKAEKAEKGNALTKKKRTRSSPEGIRVKFPPGVIDAVEERCKTSFREPSQEVAWIVCQWLNDQEPPKAAPVTGPVHGT